MWISLNLLPAKHGSCYEFCFLELFSLILHSLETQLVGECPIPGRYEIKDSKGVKLLGI
jgi:hypothetical protein